MRSSGTSLFNGYTIVPFIAGRFYEHKSYFTFTFRNLTLWQLMQMKGFVKRNTLLHLTDYGYNCDTQKGTGTLRVFKFKSWTAAELKELEKIIGSGMAHFWSFLSDD